MILLVTRMSSEDLHLLKLDLPSLCCRGPRFGMVHSAFGDLVDGSGDIAEALYAYVYGGFLGGTPYIIHFNGVFQYKPSIWGIPISGNHQMWKPISSGWQDRVPA